MNTPLRLAAGAAVLSAALCAGCVVPGDGYGYGGGNVGVTYGVNFFEPFDNNGGWGPGYLVGPPRGGDRNQYHRDNRGGRPAYRPGPAGHAMPSIPDGRPGEGGGRDHH